MCGIVGSVGIANINPKVTQTLFHRGPDGHGEQSLDVAGKAVWLGHTRLSILDLSLAGHQPMQSRDGRWWITFNGEIYNHLDLRKSLSGPFRGHSDTETLIELIAAQGIKKTLPQLNGMFAFAALDLIKAKLHLVRDPFGIKPVYYIEDNDFSFSSEIRALPFLTNCGLKVDLDGLQTFLTLRFVPSPNTLFRKVRRLAPGYVLVVDLETNKIQIRCYAKPQMARFQGSLKEACSIYKNKLDAAIGRQLLSDVPVGILLSGGIDSSVIAVMAARRKQGIKTFTVGFGDSFAECEISDAAETSALLGLKHEYVRVTSASLLDSFEAVARAVEEPLGTTSTLAMWHLVAMARRDVTVALTGQGSDEPWGGYLLYQSELLRNRIPFSCLAGKLAAFLERLPWISDSLRRGLRMVRVTDEAERFCEARALFTSTERKCLTGRMDDGHAVTSIRSWTDWMRTASMSSPERMMRVDTHMNLPDDLLLYGDKISMAVSLETRVPMLDLDLIDFVESLPLSYRVTLGRRKIVHKKMALDFLPEKIVNRPKRRFEVPFGHWARNEWKPYLEALLLDGNAPYLSLVDRRGVNNVWDQHQSGRMDRSRQLFALSMLALCWKTVSNGSK